MVNIQDLYNKLIKISMKKTAYLIEKKSQGYEQAIHIKGQKANKHMKR